MAKFKIQKGLSDAEMMKQWGGNDNFEETMMQAQCSETCDSSKS